MAETTQFVMEGNFTLAYFADDANSRHVLLENDDSSSDEPVTHSQSLEMKIADELGFPNEEEFNEIFRKLDDLREKGLRPAIGEPDGIREGVKLRITVEVLS